ncbi:hypothetical protein [Thalassomonas haliotis]|uniref:Uncharacterized protein n=1 Tax=Thalassomonas haliotis TaxID=485448 RepID=A0ABY7VKF2_9GAMM|nr:hypothetical protein [Thalassomonas haliotis]WDE14219.1 hypothetical protein H3N35_12855 [Thalassomonas haliotis]
MADLTDTSAELKAEIKPVLSELVSLSDDFGKFSQECAFLCDAFAALTQEPECIVPDTSEGIRHLSYWLKCEAKGYRQKIDKLYGHLYDRVRETENKASV